MAQIAIGIAVSVIGGAISRALSKPAQVGEPRVEGLDILTSAYGLPIPKLYGRSRRAGNLIWATEIDEVRHNNTEGGGKKGGGGGGEVTITTYKYYGTFAIGICAGPISFVRRIWVDNQLKYDVSTGSTIVSSPDFNVHAVISGRGAGLETVQIYYGTEAQEPDPTIESYEGSGNVNANRGLAYAVFSNVELKHGRIPNYEFEVMTAGTEVLDSDATSGESAFFDRMVVLHNGQFLICVDGSSNYQKIDMMGNKVVLKRYISEANNLEYQYDVDEYGIMYLFSHQVGAYLGIMRLDTVNFEEVGDQYPTNIFLPGRIRVVRNANAPYLYFFKTYNDVYLLNRDTFEEIGVWEVPKTIRFITVNHTTGEAWFLSSDHYGYNQVGIYHINPATRLGTYQALAGDMDNAKFITYDDATNQLIVAGSSTAKIGFYDASDMSLNAYLNGSYVEPYSEPTFMQGPVDGFLYTTRGRNIYKINTTTYEVDKTYVDVSIEVGQTINGMIYDPVLNAAWVIVYGADMHRVYLNRLDPANVPLEDIVEDICDQVGIESTEVDTTDLTSDDVKGYRIDGRMSGRAALQPLMDAYFFDAVESDGKLKFVKRGGAVAVTIPESELAAHTYGAKRPQELTLTRGQEIDLPSSVEVSYVDANADYQQGTQQAKRINVNATGALHYKLPLTLDSDEAKQLAEIAMGEAWIARTRFNAFISNKYAYLDSTDVIQITRGGVTHRMFLSDERRGDGLMEITGMLDDANIYTSDASGTTQTIPDTTIDYAGATEFHMIDCPALDDTFDRAGIYCAAAGYTDSWSGAQIYRSLDAGQTFVTFDAITDATIIGSTDSALGNFTEGNVIDYENDITITLFDDAATLSSVTELEMLNGSNAALIGDEIIKFMTVTDDGDSKWTLSGLLRGRRGTEWAISTHSAVERFVLFDRASTIFTDLPLSDLNNERTYGAVSFGMDITSGAKRVLTTALKTLKPYSPCSLCHTVDGSKNIDLTWIRRTRIGGAWNDGGDVPLSENSEEYEIDVVVPSTETVKRTIEATSESDQYTRTDQLTDFSATDAVRFDIYQISDAVGRGWVTSLSTTIPA